MKNFKKIMRGKRYPEPKQNRESVGGATGAYNPPNNDYGGYGRQNSVSKSPAERPATRKGLLHCTAVNWYKGKDKRNKGFPSYEDNNVATGDGFRILVTRGDDIPAKNMVNEYCNNINLGNYNFANPRSEEIFAYSTASGFYNSRARRPYGGSVSPKKDNVLKEQQAFANLKAFLETNHREDPFSKIKRQYRVLHLSPLTENVIENSHNVKRRTGKVVC